MANIIKAGKGSTSYPVIIAKNAITKSNLRPHINLSKNILIITDSGIPKTYVNNIIDKLGAKKKFMSMLFLKVRPLSQLKNM